MTRARRKLLIGLGAAGAVGAWLGLPALLPAPALPLAPLEGLPGFRTLRGGATSAASDPFIGLMPTRPEGLPDALPVPDPCPLLARAAPGTVPVTLFTDAFCGVCRRFEPLLDARDGDAITLLRRPLPLLGAGSVAAARVTLAAARQGAGDHVHARLLRSRFQPGAAYLSALAEGLSLDADRLIADAARTEVTETLARNLGLAERFGLFATPAMIVGDIAVLGALDAATLDRVIAQARPAPCPAA